MRATYILLILLINLDLSYSLAEELKYPVAEIPDNLLKGADVVYRFNKGEFIIERIDRAIFKVHQVVTILNENGAGHALVGVGYDKLRKINSLSADVYNKGGKEIYKLKRKDIIDESNISGGTLYEDNRIQGVDLRQKEYPYTIEYTYEIQFKYLYSIPDWYVIPGEKISVQKSEYIVTAPLHLKPRFKAINVEEKKLKESVEGNFISYHWTFEDKEAIGLEEYSKGLSSITPIIYASPSKFSYEGYEGDMSTWDGMAIWQNSLNEGRDILPSATLEEVKILIADVTTSEAKIRRIYEYMQKRTRYVSVQLGIGGFQPFEASVVDNTGYGDCKALVNYTQALLKAGGIKSYYTWVEAGSYPQSVYEDFPNDNFNHIILCVPNAGDTVWLECTSQTIPYGYLGKFTQDRKVLVITEKGGKIVKTPSYDYNSNIIITNMTVNLDQEGNAYANLNRIYKGLGYEYNHLNYYMTLTDKDREKWLYQNLSIPSYELGNYKFIEKKDFIPSINLQVEVGIRKLATITGKRLFIPLNFMNANKTAPKPDDNRITPVYLRYSSITSDTIVFKVPENFHVEFIPEQVLIESPFGSYHMKVDKAEDGLTYYRTLKWNKGKYHPDQYNELAEFFKSIRSADMKKIVLLDKT